MLCTALSLIWRWLNKSKNLTIMNVSFFSISQVWWNLELQKSLDISVEFSTGTLYEYLHFLYSAHIQCTSTVQCAIWENFQETNRFSSSRDQRSSRVSRRFQPVQANESNQKNPIWDQLTSKLLCWPWKGPLKKAQVYSQSLFKFSFMKQFVSLCGKLHTLWEVNKIKLK